MNYYHQHKARCKTNLVLTIVVHVRLLWVIRISNCLLFNISSLLLGIGLLTLHLAFDTRQYFHHGINMHLAVGFIKMSSPACVLECFYEYLMIRVDNLDGRLVEVDKILPQWFWKALVNMEKLVVDILLRILSAN